MKTFLSIFNIRNIIAISLTLIMGILLIKENDMNDSLIALFSASYGSVVTYFFSNKKKEKE